VTKEQEEQWLRVLKCERDRLLSEGGKLKGNVARPPKKKESKKRKEKRKKRVSPDS
jgi:hypothetical protein